jgi:ABC-type sugar transport system substrate-binding protein
MMKVRRGVGLAVSVAIALGVAGCGSSSGGRTSSAASGSQAESSAATSSASAAGSSKKPFTVGYSLATGQNPWMVRISTAAVPIIKAAGGSATVADSQLQPAMAVQQITRFVNDGVNAIAVAPAQVPNAVSGILAKAHSKGIHVFGVEWSYGANPSAPPSPPLDGQVDLDRAGVAKEMSAQINHDFPNGAQVIYVGLPFPVVGVDEFEKAFASDLGKSKLVANIDNPSDNAQGALGPINSALSAHPGATAIVTYNGPTALAAVEALKTHGLSGKAKIYNEQLDPATAAGIKQGTIADAWDLNPIGLGQALGTMIAAAGDGKPRSDWAKTVVIHAPKYDKANIGTWKNWADS